MRGMHSTIEVSFVDHLLDLWKGKESHLCSFGKDVFDSWTSLFGFCGGFLYF